MWVESEKTKGIYGFYHPYEIAIVQASASQSDFIGSKSYVREGIKGHPFATGGRQSV